MNAIDTLYQQYYADRSRAIKEYSEWSTTPENQTKSYDDYKGFKLDYNKYADALPKALMEVFGLTEKQAGYIYGEAYQRYHASFGDVFYGAKDLANFVLGFPRES